MKNIIPTYNLATFQNLNKASFIELFYDLVFVFCMRSIIPVVVGNEGASVGWYPYYTFAFTYALMLQVWFNTTMLMNRFGTGGPLDIGCLVVNMFLLLTMTHAISTGWERYYVFNISWMLINANLMAHWFVRLKVFESPTASVKAMVKRAIVALGAQAALVFASFALPSVPAQALCLCALVVGTFAWRLRDDGSMGNAHREHLVERCSLLLILAFGEMVSGIGDARETDFSLGDSALFLLLALGMFLVYLNQIENVIDKSKVGSGIGYVGITAWLTFCVANVTAGFEMMGKHSFLGPLSGQSFFAISVSVFLLSFFLLLPFAKHLERIRKRDVIGRILACLGAVAFAIAANNPEWLAIVNSHEGPVGGMQIAAFALFYVAMTLAVLTVYLVLLIDWRAYGKLDKRNASDTKALSGSE